MRTTVVTGCDAGVGSNDFEGSHVKTKGAEFVR